MRRRGSLLHRAPLRGGRLPRCRRGDGPPDAAGPEPPLGPPGHPGARSRRRRPGHELGVRGILCRPRLRGGLVLRRVLRRAPAPRGRGSPPAPPGPAPPPPPPPPADRPPRPRPRRPRGRHVERRRVGEDGQRRVPRVPDDARDGPRLPGDVPGAPPPRGGGRQGAHRPHPPRADVPGPRTRNRTHGRRRSDRRRHAPLVPLLLRCPRERDAPLPRDPPRVPPPQRGPGGPALPHGLPGPPGGPRRSAPPRVAHGANRRPWGACRRLVPPEGAGPGLGGGAPPPGRAGAGGLGPLAFHPCGGRRTVPFYRPPALGTLSATPSSFFPRPLERSRSPMIKRGTARTNAKSVSSGIARTTAAVLGARAYPPRVV